MPVGIDIGTETIVIATPSGTSRHRNAIQKRDDDDGEVRSQDGSGSYAVGNAVEADAEPDDVRPLFGDSNGWDETVMMTATETFFSEAIDLQSHASPDTACRIGYVNRDAGMSTQLAHPGSELDIEFEPVDPGMAVCYDVFGPQSTDLGIAVDDGRLFGTLAIEGIPVATAQIDYNDQWYDVTGAGAIGAGGPRAEWARIRYEALFGELAAGLASQAPSLGDSIAVALGGGAVPEGIQRRDIGIIGEELQAEIESVTVAETADEAPARGALVAIQGSSGGPEAIPAFAVTDGYDPSLADTALAAEAFADGTMSGPAGTGQQLAVVPGEQSGQSASETPQRVQRALDHRARLASILDTLVERVDETGTTDRLADLREELTESIAELESEIEAVDEQNASQKRTDELEASVTEFEETLDELDNDITEIRSTLAGMDSDASFDGDVSDALGSVAVDAIQDDIDSVNETLASRIDTLWDEIDDINNSLVNVSARVEELPDIEGNLDAAREDIDELTTETTDLQRSISEIREELESFEKQAVMTDEIESLQTDLDGVRADHDKLRTRFQNVNRADPAALEDVQRDLNALQDTVVNHAQRLEGVERTVSDLDDRIGQAFQNTAKAEALTSLQAEVSRIEERASNAEETATAVKQTMDNLETSVETLTEDIDQLRRTVDGLAETSVTRTELDDSLTQLEQRLQGGTGKSTLQVLGIGLLSVGVLGALLANTVDQSAFAIGFAVLVGGPAIWLLLSVSDT